MAIKLEFFDFIIPIRIIDSAYSGGFTQFKKDYSINGNSSGKYWHDNHLFRDGAMSSRDIQVIVKEWEKLGLKGKIKVNGQNQWKDFCILGGLGLSKHPNLSCDWLVYEPDNNTVYHKGTPQGEPIGPIR